MSARCGGRHYDRLHLHTDRNHSGLPGMAMPPDDPAYPSREQMVAYLESYAARFEIKPVFGATVSRIDRDAARWRAETSQGPIVSPVVVVATGIADAPYRPIWSGLKTYSGQLIHSSSEYRNPVPCTGQRVLVIGFGNSGGEIALDLANAGVDVALAVRSPVQILLRELLGFPIQRKGSPISRAAASRRSTHRHEADQTDKELMARRPSIAFAATSQSS
jgi:cation diffusion facilitator CzcD-associated flavoprotein CzcO